MAIKTYIPGETVQFVFPRYDGETVSGTAKLRQTSGTDIDTATVETSNFIRFNKPSFPVVIDDRPGDEPVGSFIGSFDSTGRSAGEYYIILDITSTDLSGNAATYKRTARFYIGGEL